jgi:2-keto-4-pentenoate hydratase/2-oxohepta-3-ene-1,7-dioic acid hydratase in catechol pathway
VVYPPQTRRLEYEGELAVVVAKPMRDTPAKDVLENLLGYTCVNDVTARDIQVQGGNLLHLCHSKSFDTFCPTGPWIETELDAHAIDIELRINGEVRQRKTNTSDMIFPVEEMVSYFSKVMTLLPGDLILTGAPPGIGPMQPGDKVELIIQGVGTLKHTVIRKS